MKFKKIIGIGDSWTFGEGSFLLSQEKKQKLLNDNTETSIRYCKRLF